LERLSSRLAIRLQSLGIGPEVPVLLCFEKSKWHVLASLAVLKAGGVCASVDPAHPVDRLRTIAQTAKATVSLCTDHKAEEMRSVVDYVMPLSSDTMETLVESAGETTFTCSNVAPTNAAFIVFTSGSTGKPKGIVQQHGAFCWASHQFRQLIGTRPGRRVLQFAAYTFDISIVDTFITLMYGACLCIPSEHDRVNNLPGYVNSAGVNQACITPTVARTFLPEETPGLSVLCLAGEAVTKDNIASWSDKLELLNAYGPAEVSVAVLCRTNMKPDTHPADTGRPIGGGCWIVSKHSTEQLVPIGAIGELLVEGPHVARGYLHDTKKTTTSFVKSPMWFNKMNGHDDTHRFYRTGDLVRYQPDGSLFFLGRADSQVKVRGQRVELGEVEHTIYESRLASTAIVLYPTHGVLSKNLVAIVSFPGLSAAETTIRGVIRTLHKDLRSEAQRLTALLKKYLGSILPQYMIPSIWICLPSMPSTNSGKLDRKALQDWIMEMDKDVARNDSDLESEDESETTLETAAQEHVAKALSWVLNIPFEKIRSTDSFLRLGGMLSK
jgi:amino acid adenylation domain-containing protein